MPAASPIERGPPVAGQAGRASLAGSSGDASYPLGGSRAVKHPYRIASIRGHVSEFQHVLIIDRQS